MAKAKRPRKKVTFDAPVFIRMNSGGVFRYDDIEANKFNLHDFAHNLSKIGRFLGAPDELYPVAQHLCHASDFTLTFGTPFDAFAVLLHDFHEAVALDVVTPFKKFMLAHGFDYEEIVVDPLDAWIYKQCGMPWPLPKRTAEIVRVVDQVIYQAEGRSIVRGFAPTKLPAAYPKYEHAIKPWAQREAYRQLLHRFDKLYPLAATLVGGANERPAA